MSRDLRRIGWFVAVGCTAAAVHFGVVVALVGRLGWAPLVANVGGWLVALGVSYGGHRRLTFADQRTPVARSAPRFLAVSALGFVVNEGAYALLLHGSGLGYRAALAAVLLGVAVLTYLLSRHWAFLGTPAR